MRAIVPAQKKALTQHAWELIEEALTKATMTVADPDDPEETKRVELKAADVLDLAKWLASVSPGRERTVPRAEDFMETPDDKQP